MRIWVIGLRILVPNVVASEAFSDDCLPSLPADPAAADVVDGAGEAAAWYACRASRPFVAEVYGYAHFFMNMTSRCRLMGLSSTSKTWGEGWPAAGIFGGARVMDSTSYTGVDGRGLAITEEKLPTRGEEISDAPFSEDR
jgi:hypothetical protein